METPPMVFEQIKVRQMVLIGPEIRILPTAPQALDDDL